MGCNPSSTIGRLCDVSLCLSFLTHKMGDIYREVEHLNKTMHMKLSIVPSPNWMLKHVCPSGDLVFLLILTCCMDVII